MKLYQKYKQYKQNTVKQGDVFPRVEWISYHIPKTAGTSFYQSLSDSFGERKIERVYDKETSAKLSRAEPLWIAPHKRLIHGHFKVREEHAKQFPNAKRIIWVRDPIERLWSNLRHWVTYGGGAKRDVFKERYMDGKDWELPELFNCLVSDPYFDGIVNVYQQAFNFVKPKDFYFIGRSEDYDSEILRLADLMGKPLKPATKNINRIDKELPFDRKEYYKAFEKEYDFLRTHYDKDYPF